MYKINYKLVNDKIKNLLLIFVFCMVMLVLVLGLVLKPIIIANMLDGETVAHKVEIIEVSSTGRGRGDSSSYKPRYYYRVNSNEYVREVKDSLTISVKQMRELNKIYYDTKNPEKAIGEGEKKISFGTVICIAFYGFIIIIIYKELKAMLKKKKDMNWLAKNGTLIKGLTYTLRSKQKISRRSNSRTGKTDEKYSEIIVEYQTESGEKINLNSIERSEFEIQTLGKVVDLLIDPKDSTRYYIDFNILEENNTTKM